MTEANDPSPATRRRVLAGLLATVGAGSAAGTVQATNFSRRDAGQPSMDVDADNLVAGNSRLTITVEGVSGSEIQDATVTIGGIAFAAVEVLERDPAIIAVDASNVIANESVSDQDTVEVAVWVATSDGEFTGTDESQAIVN